MSRRCVGAFECQASAGLQMERRGRKYWGGSTRARVSGAQSYSFSGYAGRLGAEMVRSGPTLASDRLGPRRPVRSRRASGRRVLRKRI